MPTSRGLPSAWLLVTVLVFLLQGGCTVAQDAATGPANNTANVAALRLAHLSPDAPLVDVLIDGRLLLRDVAFGSVSGYLYVPAGRQEIKVFPHHAATLQSDSDGAATVPTATPPPPAPPAPAADSAASQPEALPRVAPLEPFVITVDLSAGSYYTLGLPGFFNPPAAQRQGGSLALELEPGTTVRITGPRSYTIGLEQSQTLDRLEPGRYTVTGSRDGFQTATLQLRVNAGETTTLPINLQGVTAPPPSDASPSTPPTVTPQTTTLTPTPATAQEDAPPVWHRTQLQLYEDVFTTMPPAGQVFLRVVHAAPGVNAVDVARLAGTGPAATAPAVLLNDLSFPDASPYVAVTAGQQTLELRLAGTDFVLATVQDARLVPGAFYTLYLVGTLNDRFLTPLPTVDIVLRSPFGTE